MINPSPIYISISRAFILVLNMDRVFLLGTPWANRMIRICADCQCCNADPHSAGGVAEFNPVPTPLGPLKIRPGSPGSFRLEVIWRTTVPSAAASRRVSRVASPIVSEIDRLSTWRPHTDPRVDGMSRPATGTVEQMTVGPLPQRDVDGRSTFKGRFEAGGGRHVR